MDTSKKQTLINQFEEALAESKDGGIRVRVKVKREYRYTFAHGPIINRKGTPVIGCNGISGLQPLSKVEIRPDPDDKTLTDDVVCDKISDILNKPWQGEETLADIAEVMRQGGYTIKEAQ